MGAELSKAEEKLAQAHERLARQAEERARRSSGHSRAEVDQLLAQQKREYEKKLRELQIQHASNSSTAASSNEPAREEIIRTEQLRGHINHFLQLKTSEPPPRPSPPRLNHGNSTGDYAQPSRSTQNQLYPSLSSVSTSYYQTSPQKTELQRTHGQLPGPVQPSSTIASSSFEQDFVFVNGQRFKPSAPFTSTGNVCKSKPTRSRSQSNKDEDEELNCVSCKGKYGLRIFQCNSGHSSCENCKLQSVPCGLCRGTISDIRNITLEAYLSERKVPCPNASDGCSLYIKIADIDIHVKECPFNEVLCPLHDIFGRCSWRGKISHLVSHFDDVHPENRQGKVDAEMVLLNIINTNHIVYHVDIASYNFIVHIKIDGGQHNIYMAVQLMGTKMSASKWYYELQMYNKRESRKKFVYSDICQSHVTPIDEIIAQSSCVVVPQSYAMNYVNEGCITYKFYIKKDSEFNPPSNYRGRGRGRRNERTAAWRGRGAMNKT